MNIHTAIVHSCEIMRKHEIYIRVIFNFYKKDSCVDMAMNIIQGPLITLFN